MQRDIRCHSRQGQQFESHPPAKLSDLFQQRKVQGWACSACSPGIHRENTFPAMGEAEHPRVSPARTWLNSWTHLDRIMAKGRPCLSQGRQEEQGLCVHPQCPASKEGQVMAARSLGGCSQNQGAIKIGKAL